MLLSPDRIALMVFINMLILIVMLALADQGISNGGNFMTLIVNDPDGSLDLCGFRIADEVAAGGLIDYN